MIFDKIAKQVRRQLAIDVAGFPDAPSTAALHATPSGGLAPVASVDRMLPEKITAVHAASKTKPAVVPSMVSPKPFRPKGRYHPWGDACLNSLRISTTGSDGGQKLEFDRERLYKVREDCSPKRFLVNDWPDLFNVKSNDIIREHLSVFRNASWHRFVLLTNNLERARDLKMHGTDLPLNLWIGTSIESREDFQRIKDLAALDHEAVWLSFADYRSSNKYPLADAALYEILERRLPRWIVGRADLEGSGPDFSVDDAVAFCEMLGYIGSCTSFFAQPGTKAAFARGEDIRCPGDR